MSRSDQHEHAVDADVCDEGKSKRSADQSGIVNGHGKSKNANPDVPLQDVDYGFKVSEKMLDFYSLDFGTPRYPNSDSSYPNSDPPFVICYLNKVYPN